MDNQLILCPNSSYNSPFKSFGKITSNIKEFMGTPEKFRLVVFTGGEDVDPSLYGHINCYSESNFDRDMEEIDIFKMAVKHKIPMAGICRGMQFLNVMAGGSMYQHIAGHAGSSHTVTTNNGKDIKVNSLHHQLVNINPKVTDVIAWSSSRISGVYFGNGGAKQPHPEKEVEAAYFRNINAVGAQWHPELLHEDSEGFTYYVDLVKDLLTGGKKNNG